jgi:hypothetical protein
LEKSFPTFPIPIWTKIAINTFFIIKDAKTLNVTTRGQRVSHQLTDDPNRTMFELTKTEFQEECICEFCCQKFNSDDSLNQHHKIMNETVFKCPKCSVQVKNFQARNLHFLTRHTLDNPYSCSNPVCKISFKTRY